MSRLLNNTVDLLQPALAERTAAEAGRLFHHALRPFGVKASYIRSYRSSSEPEQTYSRISPPGWEEAYSRLDFGSINYLPREVKKRTDPFAWSQVCLLDSREKFLAQYLIDNGFPDGLAVPCHGAGGYFAVVSLAFEGLGELSPDERAAIELASLVMHSRMRALAPNARISQDYLTPRERDCLGLISVGRTDDQIAEALGISRNTVITHVKNAKRKLDVQTRAQAVAQALHLSIL